MTSIFDNRIPLSRIQQLDDLSNNLKRSILISHQKLPKDFFPSKNCIKKQFSVIRERTNLLSQNMRRNFSNIDSLRSNEKRQSMTAREHRIEKQQDLILGIISASKQIKRVIRKHSMELRKKENKILDSNINFSKRSLVQKGIQLPPLLLKKGATLAF